MSLQQQLVGTGSENLWRSFLPASTSVFGGVEFARLQERFQRRQARLFVFEEGESRVVYPFLLRPLSELSFEFRSTGARWDSTTPEFTGPFGLSQNSAEAFSSAVHRLWSDLGVVTEFIHLNPWSGGSDLLPAQGLKLNRDLVWIDTTLSENELWSRHFSHACRKNVKRAEREGVRVYEATGLDDIHEFHRIYRETMDRNQALGMYYFPLEYFIEIFNTMRQHARFVMAEHQGRIVAATLYLHDDTNVYSYLGGAGYEYQSVRPTNAVVLDTITWARSRGKQRLVLGGGYQPGDGIFRFKASFSQLRVPFYIYERVHLAEQYSELRDKWYRSYEAPPENISYFPIYRAPSAQGQPVLTSL